MSPSVRLDTLVYVETPEGIELQADLAGPLVRVLAFGFDLIVRAGILLVLAIVLSILLSGVSGAKVVFAIMTISYFLLEWFYPVYFEVWHSGQTPGKKVFRIAVVSSNLSPVRFDASIVRNLLRAVDFLPLFYLTGLAFMSFTSRFQRLGDLAADTLVIYRPKTPTAVEEPDGKAEPPPPGWKLDDQQVLLDFSERKKNLSPQRSEELAGILADVLNARGSAAVDKLYAFARWIRGAR